MSHLHLSQTLADSFNALADQVQALADHKTILEHKLRFAHEQFQILADKHAPANSEIAETLAKLQLPPHHSADDNSTVPLPLRSMPHSQLDVALIIRDGRRVANQLASLVDASKTTGSSRETISRAYSDEQTSMATTLEHDFTIEGKKGNLQCPFSKPATATNGDGDAPEVHDTHDELVDGTRHHSSDPICAAMYEEATSHPAPTTANGAASSKCPIRYLDQHSAEEIAHYVETHKHELPRSHEVCVRRYQRNEDQIRKLDSKYGNLVSMIEGLTHIHQSMLPEDQKEPTMQQSEVDKASNERVQSWAKDVSATTDPEEDQGSAPTDGDRQSHFDRPLKEVRVGESPSRPWGISVPVYELLDHEHQRPMSPPPAPVRMTSPVRSPVRSTHSPAKPGGGKCPFDHTKLSAFPSLDPVSKPEANPFEHSNPTRNNHQHHIDPVEPDPPNVTEQPQPSSAPNPQPAFINPDVTKAAAGATGATPPATGFPQMVFTGPVFIGYPMDQALEFMKQYQGNQR